MHRQLASVLLLLLLLLKKYNYKKIATKKVERSCPLCVNCHKNQKKVDPIKSAVSLNLQPGKRILKITLNSSG